MELKSPSRKSFISGSLWMISMRWSMRLIGFVSTIILARILAPSDFGIVAMAMIVVALFEIITLTGVDLALLREKEISENALNTAWTIQIIQGLIVTILLICVAPLANSYFNEPRAAHAIQILALRPLLEGFQNIGVVFFRKELDFSKEFKFGLYKKLINFTLVITFAVILKNYWALVLGIVTAAAVGLLLSYIMHPYRPKFSLASFNRIWGFSQWLLFSRIGKFLNMKIDQFIVGGNFGTSTMGNYYIGFQISTMLTDELVMPIRRALFPNLANLLENKDEFNKVSITMLSIVAALCIPIGFGLSATANDFVYVVLGEQWGSTVPIVQYLAIFAVAMSISSSLEILLLVTGNSKFSAFESWSHLIILTPIAYYIATHGDITQIASARMITGVTFIFLSFYLVSRATKISLVNLLSTSIRPLCASLIMYLCLKFIDMTAINSSFIRLFASIGLGAFIYCVSLLSIWNIFGKSKCGLEYLAIEYLKSKLKQN